MKDKYKIPDVITKTEFQIVLENFVKNLYICEDDSNLALMTILVHIELVSRMRHGYKEIQKDRILTALDIKYPKLFWTIFRHGCMHKSYPQSILLNDKFPYREIWWGTTFGNIKRNLKRPLNKYKIIESVNILDSKIIYSVSIDNLINNFLIFLREIQYEEFKSPDILRYKDLRKPVKEEICNMIENITFKNV